MHPWRRHRQPLASLLCALTLSALLSSCASTTPRRVEAPQLPPAPPPAECTTAAFKATAPTLALIPGDSASWAALPAETRARVLLGLKKTDAVSYRTLRAQAIRCGR